MQNTNKASDKFKQTEQTNIVKLLMPFIAAVLIIIAGCIVNSVICGGSMFNTDILRNNVHNLENQKLTLKSQLEEQKQKVKSDVLGVSYTRYVSDVELADEFFTELFTWNNGKECIEVQEKYKDKLSDDFKKDFFINKDADYIDNKDLNCHVSNIDFYFKDIDKKSVTSYVCILKYGATATFVDSKRNISTDNDDYMYLTFDVTDDGNIVNVTGIV